MEEEKLERVCFNCNDFFPATMEEPTEYGICLNDNDFEPFIEELFEHSNYSSCQDLINSKKFDGDREGCETYEEVEYTEVDDDSPFGQVLNSLKESGELNPETVKDAIAYEQIRNIDFKTLLVDGYVKQLQSPMKSEQKVGITSLSAMIAHGNEEAFKELLKYFKSLSPPETLEEVYFKKDILSNLERSDTSEQMIPYMINELYITPSNNTTRQWISAIFKFLEFSPKDMVREPLEKMLKDKRFSYRLKKKMKKILYDDCFGETW